MIKIPTCLFCENYDSKSENCPAYPEGIPDEILFSKTREDVDCGNGVGFHLPEGEN